MKISTKLLKITWHGKLFVELVVTLFSLSQANAAISLFDNVAYTQNFNTLPYIGSQYYKSEIPESWTFVEVGLYGDDFFDANERYGSANTYSYGTSSDTSLGGISNSYTLIPIIGASFTNNVGVGTIDVSINYTGEQWRLGSQGQQHVDFQYSTDATNLTNGTWTNFDLLDLYASVTTGAPGPLGGNDPNNQSNFSGTIYSLEVPIDSTFWIRWHYGSLDTSVALTIDDFSIVAVPELSSPLLAAFGLSGLLFWRRRIL